MNSVVSPPLKYSGTIIEYLDQGRLKAALVTREQERHLAVIDSAGHERLVPRDLVLMRHPERSADRENVAEALKELEHERAELAAELDLELLWQVAQEQSRSFSAVELAELFFGRKSNAAASVMLEALLNDRTYFVRRHMDFVPRTPEQVDRLRIQNDRIRARSDDYRKIQKNLRDVLIGAEKPPADEAAALIEELSRYLKNPFTRSRDMTQMLSQAAPDVDPAEAAFEILERLGAPLRVPRFAFIAGLKDEFSDAVMKEAVEAVPGPRAISDGGYAVTVDDEDTVEVDDALSCEPLADGGVRVRVHIALVADFVAKGGAMDREAAVARDYGLPARDDYQDAARSDFVPRCEPDRGRRPPRDDHRRAIVGGRRAARRVDLSRANSNHAAARLRPWSIAFSNQELTAMRPRRPSLASVRRRSSCVNDVGPRAPCSCSGAKPRSGCMATTWKSPCWTTRLPGAHWWRNSWC